MTSPTKIAIIGAGPAGMTLFVNSFYSNSSTNYLFSSAHLLIKQSTKCVTIFEGEASPSVRGRKYDLKHFLRPTDQSLS